MNAFCILYIWFVFLHLLAHEGSVCFHSCNTYTWYRNFISEGVVRCSQSYIRILKFFRHRLLYNRKVPSKVQWQFRQATRKKISPSITIYKDIADRNKPSWSGLLFDHGISGTQKISEKNTLEFRGHSLSKKKAEKFCAHSKFPKKAPDFRGITPAIPYINMRHKSSAHFQCLFNQSISLYFRL